MHSPQPPQLETWQHELPNDEWGSTSELLSSLGRGHDPLAVMLTCAELGHVPHEVGRANPGEIMVIQNLAGIVPACGQEEASVEVASLCYALAIPTVRHLIVCGHRRCRVLSGLLSGRWQHRLAGYCDILAEIRQALSASGESTDTAAGCELAVQQMVLQQLRHLRSYPEIRQRIDRGSLRIHGWVYDEQTAIAHRYDPQRGRFSRSSGTCL